MGDWNDRMITGKVAKCWNCGRLYRIYVHMVGDQSVCRRCSAEVAVIA